jgi:hypothetical protein
MLVLIFIGLLILAYFSFDLRGLVESETFKNNAALIKEVSLGVWGNYIKSPVLWVFGKISLIF